jgi:hypothetical protein
VLGFGETAFADWGIDFSRRSRATREADLQANPSNLPARRPASDSSSMNSSASSDGGSVSDSFNANTVNNGANGNAASSSASGAAGGGILDSARKLVNSLLDAGGEPVQDIVIMNTDHGFVPSTVRVRRDNRYKIHIVNVNEKEKNVSFILDAFSEHHATYYGKIQSFFLEPKKDGVFSFQSPETSAEGKLVVLSTGAANARGPASDDRK